MPDGGRPLRVLAIEDSADDYWLMLRALRGAGLEVEGCRVDTEADFVGALDASSWDLICVDWVLPRMDAPTVLRILAELEIDAPCVVVSGMGDVHVAQLARDCGAAAYVAKDHLEALAPIVQRELHLRGRA